MIDLSGRVALVTGASRGIGRACAIRLAEAGADVVINYVTSQAAAMEVARQNRRPGPSRGGGQGRRRRAGRRRRDDGAHRGTVRRAEHHRQQRRQRRFSAACYRPPSTNFEATMKTNVLALVHLVQCGLKLLERGPGRGKVIALSSHGSNMALPMYGMIGGSKAALESLARHFALECGPKGINVNIVKAGLVDTDSTRKLPHSAGDVRGHQAVPQHDRRPLPTGRGRGRRGALSCQPVERHDSGRDAHRRLRCGRACLSPRLHKSGWGRRAQSDRYGEN